MFSIRIIKSQSHRGLQPVSLVILDDNFKLTFQIVFIIPWTLIHMNVRKLAINRSANHNTNHELGVGGDGGGEAEGSFS